MAGRATSQIARTTTDLVAAARQVLVGDYATRVWDGPSVTDDDAKDVLWIGVDDPQSDENLAAAAVGEQDWGSIGNYVRDEHFTINGACMAWSGVDNNRAGETDPSTGEPYPDVFATLRDRAFARIALVEQAIRDDPSVGALLQGSGSTLRQVGMQVTTVTQLGSPGEGSAVLVGFQFLCWCRI